MRKTLVVLALLLAGTTGAAAEPEYGPAVVGYGPVYEVADRDVAIPDDHSYKAVFDVAPYQGDTGDLNVRLQSVARFINMHATNGVDPERMDLAVVLHGPALRAVLSESAHRERYGASNPNSELLGHLQDIGVKFYVCGQSMNFRGISKDELHETVELALSAMTMLVDLQADGYALLP